MRPVIDTGSAWLYACQGCGARVSDPETYRCSDCGGRFQNISKPRDL